MKKLSFLLASAILSLAASAQLQNLDFENWNRPVSENLPNTPTGWTWTNGLVIDSLNNFYYPPATYAQQNNYALYLSVWYNYTKDAAIQRAPISARPGFLSGWYNYKHNIIGGPNGLQRDIAMVSVYLTKHNHNTNATDTIGKGIMEIGDSTDVYTGFLLEINYTSAEMPDSITIILDPSLVNRYRNGPGFAFVGDENWGCCTSFFLVDNLSLHGSVMGLDDANKSEQLAVYPNPATNEIRLNLNGEINIWDALGRKVAFNYNNNNGTIDVSSFNSGQYFIQIKNGQNIYKGKFIKL